MKLLRKGVLVISLVTMLLFQLPGAIAQEGSGQGIDMNAEAGFDGLYKAEYWVPLKATVSNNGPDVEGLLQVTVENSVSGDEVIYTNPISLPNGSNKQQTFFIYLPGFTGDVTVQLLDDGGDLLDEATTGHLTLIAPQELLYGVVSTEPSEFTILEQFPGSRVDAAVAFLTLEDLPKVAPAWNSLDVIVFHNVDTGQLTTEQMEALQAWLEVGGQIVVSGGSGWQKTSAGLSSFLPVTITGNETREDLPGLRDQAGLPFRDPGSYLLTKSRLTTGKSILLEDEVPLLARRDYGRGAVYFLALDPALPPMVDWDGSKLVWSEIALSTPTLPLWGEGATNGYAASNAASSLPSLTLPSGAQLFLYLFLYILIIGPINYLVLSRKNRRELAWLTIPALVILFSGLTYLVGFSLKGNETILNQLSVAFGHVDSGQLRVQSLLGLYSPTRDTYDLTLPREANARPFSQSFGGLSGGGNIEKIERGNDLRVKGIRIDVSDVQTLVADSYQAGPALSAKVQMKVVEGQFVAAISVHNNGDENYENVTLLLGTMAIPIGDLQPGEAATLTESVGSILTSSPGGAITLGMAPVGPTSSPLATSYGTLLGTTNFFNDRDVYPRWQLLESIAPDGTPFSGLANQGNATLVAWSDKEQLALRLDDEPIESVATTLYFLEVPFNESALEGVGISVPKTFIDWRVMDDSGLYNPDINDYYFPPGWIEYEYTPWSQFQNMNHVSLAVVLESGDSMAQQPLPQIKIWNWPSERWDGVDDLGWGKTQLTDHEDYLGPGHAVRLRMENSTAQGIAIQELYPELVGDLGS